MAEKSIKEQLDDIPNVVKNIVRDEMDLNKDGRTTLAEGLEYVGKVFNGEGFKILLVTLGSVIFNYIYDFILNTYFSIENGHPLTFIGGLVFASILTYAYKNVMSHVDSTYAEIMERKDLKIDDLLNKLKTAQDQVQADKLAIELLKHDCENYEKELSRMQDK